MEAEAGNMRPAVLPASPRNPVVQGQQQGRAIAENVPFLGRQSLADEQIRS